MASRKISYAVGYFAFLCVVLFVGLELAFKLDRFKPTFTSKAVTRIYLDRKILYRIVPRSNSDINNYGYRDRDFTKEKAGKRRVLFLGDSFIYGIGAAKTLPQSLEEILGSGYEVYNLGVYGYGPDQSLVQLMEEGLDLNPDMVILGIFAANDYGDIYKNRLFYVDKGGALRKSPSNIVTSNIPSLDALYMYTYLKYRYTQQSSPSIYEKGPLFDLFYALMEDGYSDDLIENPDSKEAVEKKRLMEGILAKFAQILGERRIPFYVVIIPNYLNITDPSGFEKKGLTPDMYFANEKSIARACYAASIPYIDLTPVFYKHREEPLFGTPESGYHLSPYGIEFAANIIKGRIFGQE